MNQPLNIHFHNQFVEYFFKEVKTQFSLEKLTRETDAPVLYARPVRPIRCTYPAASQGMSKFITCKRNRKLRNVLGENRSYKKLIYMKSIRRRK